MKPTSFSDTCLSMRGQSDTTYDESLNGSIPSPNPYKLRPDGTLRSWGSASTNTAVFAEPGARDSRGEFIRWVYVKTLHPAALQPAHIDASMRYPWPFVSRAFSHGDHELILAHWHMTKLSNWPLPWRDFANDIAFCVQQHRSNRLYWALAAYTNAGVPSKLFDPMPPEVVNVFARPD